MAVPITTGTGSASVAAEVIATQQYQQIKVVDGTAASTNKWVVNSDGSAMVSVIGGLQVTGSVLAEIGGSVISVQKGSVGAVIIGGSVIAQVIGSVVAVQQGSVGAVVIGGSVISQVIGSVITVFQDSSLIARVTGSVTAINLGSIISLNIGSIITTNIGSVITVWQNSSVLAVPVGSTIAYLQAPSIVGTYSEDVAYTAGDKGLFILGMRNDLMASITSADLEYSGHAVGPVGEKIVANSPITKWIRGTADLRVVLGASVTAIAAQGASVFTYITGVQIANIGGASVLVTLAGGLGSILAYSIAPAGGGSNIQYPNALKTGENSAFTASISGVASVLVSAQGFTAKI